MTENQYPSSQLFYNQTNQQLTILTQNLGPIN